MIGQHPQAYGLPETQLFCAETIAEWWDQCSISTFPMADGLLRAVAQLHCGGQTPEGVRLACGWLRRRFPCTTGMILEELAQPVVPRMLVEKSPSLVYRVESMQRCFNMFPGARFLYLLRHPRGHGESVMKAIRDMATFGPVPHWVIHLATYPSLDPHDSSPRRKDLDPQRGWYVLNTNIRSFLTSVPPQQKLEMKGEDLLHDRDASLQRLAEWLGLRSGHDAIEAMKHPERSVYACWGPEGARAGNDPFFLENPRLRPEQARVYKLEGPMPWSSETPGFLPEVVRLAREMGYQ